MSLAPPAGRHPLGTNRRLVNDLLSFSQNIPLFPLERDFDLGEVGRLREQCEPRISWAVLFIKAYGLLCREMPVLRQSYISFPWPHIYQHADSTAMIAVERLVEGEERVCWGRFTTPENQPLTKMHEDMQVYKTGPVEQVYRRQMRLSRFPTPLRRLAWWMSLNLSGVRRARRLGTFGLTTVSALGATNRFHPTCTTTSMTYGPLREDGRMMVTLVFDHRVTDGAPIARALTGLEAKLQGPIADELATLAARAQAA